MSPNRARSIVLTALVALVLAACGDRGGDERPPEPGDVAAARVAGEVVWASDVKREAVAQGIIGEGEPLDPASDLFRQVLDQVIDQKLMAREAERRRLHESPVAQRRLAAARERILGDMLVETTLDDAINENHVRALYEEHRAGARESEEIRARLILVRSKAEGDAVMSLLGQGASFEALAMERSVDQTTRFNGGDLGYFTIDIMPDAYAEALKTARAGETVGPFQTDGGWAVVRVDDRRREEPLSLEEARPQILRLLTFEHVRVLLEKLRRGAKVEMLIDTSVSVPGAPKEPASAPAAPAPSADAPAAQPAAQPAPPAKGSAS